MRLAGRVALVSGGTYGIGATIVERLAEEGAAVVFTGRSTDHGAELERSCRRREWPVTYCSGSAADEPAVRRAVDTAVQTYGSLSIVVNNAAATDVTRPGGGDSHVTEIENAAFDAVWHVGVHGVLWTCKYAIPHLREAGGGAIVNISAASSLRAIEGRPAYQASKGAVNALTRQIAVDYGRDGIRCNAIAVGFTPTGGEVMTRLLANEAFMASIRTAIPSHRLGRPVDIANGCVFLASDEGSYVNGVVLPIDGGYTAKLAIPDTSSLALLDDQ
jgi:3-oxoacyl-[acyl-carrier protein] reductase